LEEVSGTVASRKKLPGYLLSVGISFVNKNLVEGYKAQNCLIFERKMLGFFLSLAAEQILPCPSTGNEQSGKS
jgi:hypothetical protein